MYASKWFSVWFSVWLNGNIRSDRGVSMYKGSKIQKEVGVKTTQRLFRYYRAKYFTLDQFKTHPALAKKRGL